MSDKNQELILVGRMAAEMTKKLATNRHKRHWDKEGLLYLLGRLEDEVDELRDAAINGVGVWSEAADVANFAAMIADNFDVMKGDSDE